MQLIKFHALGNDFLVFEGPPPPDAPDAARVWCHRTTGIGADGLIYIDLDGSDQADARMSLFNADGSRAEISGNGIRCAALVVGTRTGKQEFTIETLAGIRTVSTTPGDSPAESMVSVDMGAVGPGPSVPDDLASLIGGGFVGAESASVGNPHVVIQVDDLDKIDVATVGPAIEALFPGGINVHFMQVVGSAGIALRHWERGVGITEACGSGATVAATLAHRRGLVESEVAVGMPGGQARVLVGPVSLLVGPAVYVATVETRDA